MVNVPQQDWLLYERLSRESDAAWARCLTPNERFVLYADMFNTVWNARRNLGDWKDLDRWSWEQKLDARIRMVDAFTKRD